MATVTEAFASVPDRHGLAIGILHASGRRGDLPPGQRTPYSKGQFQWQGRRRSGQSTLGGVTCCGRDAGVNGIGQAARGTVRLATPFRERPVAERHPIPVPRPTATHLTTKCCRAGHSCLAPGRCRSPPGHAAPARHRRVNLAVDETQPLDEVMSERRASETGGNVVHWSPTQSRRRLHMELCTTHTTVQAIHQGPSGVRAISVDSAPNAAKDLQLVYFTIIYRTSSAAVYSFVHNLRLD